MSRGEAVCKPPHSPGLVREGFLEEGVPGLREVPAAVRAGRHVKGPDT